MRCADPACRPPARRPTGALDRRSGSGAAFTSQRPPPGTEPASARSSPSPESLPPPPPPAPRRRSLPLQLLGDSGDTQTRAPTPTSLARQTSPCVHPYSCLQMPACMRDHTHTHTHTLARSLSLSLVLGLSLAEPPNIQTQGRTVRGWGRSAPFPQPPYHAAAPGPGVPGPHRGAPRWLS